MATRKEHVCDECVQTAIWHFAYVLEGDLQCAGCGAWWTPQEGHRMTTSDIVAGGFAWVCPICAREHEMTYRGPQVERAIPSLGDLHRVE